jgi:hypothetical protein
MKLNDSMLMLLYDALSHAKYCSISKTFLKKYTKGVFLYYFLFLSFNVLEYCSPLFDQNTSIDSSFP